MNIAQWIDGLIARGVTLKAKGMKLELIPKSAYHAVLTDEDRATLKAHREDIIALVTEQYSGRAEGVETTSPSTPQSEPPPAPAPPPPEPCPYCHHTPERCDALKARSIENWEAIHYHHPDVAAERRKKATAEMMHQIGRPLPDRYTGSAKLPRR